MWKHSASRVQQTKCTQYYPTMGNYLAIHGTAAQDLWHALKCLRIVNKESSHLCLPISSQSRMWIDWIEVDGFKHPARATKSTKRIQTPKQHSRQLFFRPCFLPCSMELNKWVPICPAKWACSCIMPGEMLLCAIFCYSWSGSKWGWKHKAGSWILISPKHTRPRSTRTRDVDQNLDSENVTISLPFQKTLLVQSPSVIQWRPWSHPFSHGLKGQPLYHDGQNPVGASWDG